MKNITIGFVLKELRKLSGLTQKELAKNLNLSQSFISKIEREQTEPTVKIIDQYANFFCIDADILIAFRKCEDKDTLIKNIKKLLYRTVLEQLDQAIRW